MTKLDRAVFAVIRHEAGWAVEHDGAISDACPLQEEALAAASRRARASNDRGCPARISVQGSRFVSA